MSKKTEVKAAYDRDVPKVRDAIEDALGGHEMAAGLVALGQVSALMLAAYGDPGFTERWFEALRASIEKAQETGITLEDVAEAVQSEH